MGLPNIYDSGGGIQVMEREGLLVPGRPFYLDRAYLSYYAPLVVDVESGPDPRYYVRFRGNHTKLASVGSRLGVTFQAIRDITYLADVVIEVENTNTVFHVKGTNLELNFANQDLELPVEKGEQHLQFTFAKSAPGDASLSIYTTAGKGSSPFPSKKWKFYGVFLDRVRSDPPRQISRE